MTSRVTYMLHYTKVLSPFVIRSSAVVVVVVAGWRGGEKDLTPCSLCKFLLQSSRSGDVSVKAARLIKIQLVIILLQLIALFLSPTQSQPNTHTVKHAQTHTACLSLNELGPGFEIEKILIVYLCSLLCIHKMDHEYINNINNLKRYINKILNITTLKHLNKYILYFNKYIFHLYQF